MSFSYLAENSTPEYSYGKWVHLKVVCCENRFLCFINFKDGYGDRLVFDRTDTALSTGSAGIRSGYMSSENQNQFGNYSIRLCDLSALPAPKTGPTPTFRTPGPESSTSDSLDVFHLTQNLFFNPSMGPVSIFVQYSFYPGRYRLWIEDSHGKSVKVLDSKRLEGPVSQTYQWDGTDQNGQPCPNGTYTLYLDEPLSFKSDRIHLVR